MNTAIIEQEYFTDSYDSPQLSLPSEETHSDIENLTSSQTTAGVELRVAPPDGTPIGGVVPLESPGLLLMMIPFVIYYILKAKYKQCKR